MSRLQIALLVVVVAEAAACAWIFGDRAPAHIPDVNAAMVDAETAERIAAERASLDTLDPEAWQALGRLYIAHGYYPQAVESLARAFALAPSSPEICYTLAIALERMGRLDEAIARFEQAADLGQAAATCRLRIAWCRLRHEDVAGAESAFRRAIDATPEQPLAHVGLCRILIETGRVDEALPIIERLLADYPEALQPYELRAAAEAARGNHRAAREFEEYADYAPGPLTIYDPLTDFDAVRAGHGFHRHGSLAVRALGESRFDEAMRESRTALALEHSRSVTFVRASACLRAGRPDDAIEALEQALRYEGATASILVALGDAWHAAGDEQQALRYWERAARLPASGEVHARLADHYRRAGMPERAAEHEARARHWDGVLALRARDFRTARRLLEQAAEIDGRSAPTWFYLGEARRWLHDARGAEAAYRQCLELDPDHGRAIEALARLTSSAP